MAKLVVLVLGAVLLLAACGDDDDARPRERAGLPPSPLRDPHEAGRSGTETRRACELVGIGALRRLLADAGAAAPRELVGVDNDSLDLSICDWHGGAVRNLRLIVDSAPQAQLRYFNQLAEQLEYKNFADVDPGQRPQQLRGIGQDSAYGGAGAWWTPARKQLIAYAHKRIVRVRVVVRGLDDAGRRSVAAGLARTALRRLARD